MVLLVLQCCAGRLLLKEIASLASVNCAAKDARWECAANAAVALLRTALTDAVATEGVAGATAAVVRCGQLEWVGAAGTVSKQQNAAFVTPETIYVYASTTKTQVAVMIVALIESGRLTRGTTLDAFFPDLPNAKSVTVHHLLHHSSGLPDYEGQLDLSDPAKQYVRKQILAVVADLPPAFEPPGSKHVYSNTGYVVLGGIIEAVVSPQSLEQYWDTIIRKRLGLADASWGNPERTGNFAHPIDASGTDQLIPGVGIPTSYWGPVWTDGGLSSSVADLARFLDGLLVSGLLLSPASVAYMTEPEGSPDDPYCAGIFERDSPFGALHGHEGSYGGFESQMWTHRSANLTIAVQLGGEDVADRVWEKVAEAYFSSAYFEAVSRQGFPCPTVLLARDAAAGPSAATSPQKPKLEQNPPAAQPPDASSSATTAAPVPGSPRLAISSSNGRFRASASGVLGVLIATVARAVWTRP